MVLYYDRKHQPTELTGAVYLRLSKPTSIGYKLVDANKLSIVKDGYFKIKRQVSNHAYELKLLERLKHIHPVISIAHLKQAIEDPYNRHIQLPRSIIVN